MPYRFLTITRKELRAAARRKGTFRLRWWAALLAILASGLMLTAMPRMLLAGAVTPLYSLQGGLALAFALLAGAFLTSDSLSEERREGTLGLLLLTELTPIDVVLGKFAAMALNAFYGLLVFLPIMALPLLFGGVGFGEFCRVTLALLNTLFFSLALGLAVSAFLTDYSLGLAATLGLLAFFGCGLPALAELSVWAGGGPGWSRLGWGSPLYCFACARDTAYGLSPLTFWAALLCSHFSGWLCLALASVGLNRAWQQLKAAPELSPRKLKVAGRKAVRSRPLADERAFDPVVRLVGEWALLRWMAWGLVIGWGILLWANRHWPALGCSEFWSAKLCAFLLKILIAFQACRFFVETRRNGAFELLCCTPLRTADLLQAQWRSLLRLFLGPLVLFVGLCWLTVAFPAVPPARGWVAPSTVLPGLGPGFMNSFLLTAVLAADVLALGWCGMWLALTIRTPALAPALTIVAILILPLMVFRFDLVVDMVLISWATTRFQGEFRHAVLPLLNRELSNQAALS